MPRLWLEELHDVLKSPACQHDGDHEQNVLVVTKLDDTIMNMNQSYHLVFNMKYGRTHPTRGCPENRLMGRPSVCGTVAVYGVNRSTPRVMQTSSRTPQRAHDLDMC